MGSLIVDGALNFGGIPGFNMNGNLDLGALGITLPQLQGLGIDFGGALDGLNLNLNALPGFNLGTGSLDLGLAFPGVINMQ